MSKRNDTRIRPVDITPTMQVQFCQHFEARTAFALKDCMHTLFFNPIRSRVQPGDRITLNQFPSTNWEQLQSFVHLRVVKIDMETGEVFVKAESEMVSCDLDVPDAIDGQRFPVRIKRLGTGRYAITGLEDDGFEPDFETRKAANDWIERNSKVIYDADKAEKEAKEAA